MARRPFGSMYVCIVPARLSIHQRIRHYGMYHWNPGFVVLTLVFSPYQLLLSVDSNGALQRPSLFGLRSLHSGGVHNDSTLGQLFLNLNACCLVVYMHLLFSKTFCICWKLCRPSWSRAVFSGSTLYANTGWFPWGCNNTSQREWRF